MDALTFILQALPDAAGARVLDVGSGRGGLARPLQQAGLHWLGLEIDPEAAAACAKAGHPVIRGDARALPFEDRSFAGAIFLNSLHHVPVAFMASALAEALRVAGRVIIVEPRAYGGLFDALKPIDDETEVRRAAQAAIVRFCDAAKLQREEEWVRVERFADFETFVQRMVAADQTRAEGARLKRADLERAFMSAAVPCGRGGFDLMQPMIGHVVSRA
ncbi:ubiquinone/menaquinone biosynthesis methyltransferase [Agaricicola taiwanensis]|uniref:Ubiquinone/menaquinone biosynthesis methyltransferase n=1 Tax=Agaricicola taiwanensis TaxID=591372 RepID=A0A8J2VWR2_9RHOB|nr:class I SAM-dependent methyltransferase [Agaricicola taiwanensis]GGE41844.1 ubiquinone/menaquinone biosynthesis methyltransferase [Agaricicola taiwanensis]